MDVIFFEKQEGALCGQHALNNLLQRKRFTPDKLAEIARKLDEEENEILSAHSTEPSRNVDDTGFFSIQVIKRALKTYDLELVSLNSQEAVEFKSNPNSARGFICNLGEHWFTIRKLGHQWFNLNSMLNKPQLLSDMYLELYLCELNTDGYSIFVVMGNLLPCRADELLFINPINPAEAAESQPIREDQSNDPELRRVMALSLGNDKKLGSTILASRLEESEDISLRQAIGRSLLEDGMQEADSDLQRALEMSLRLEHKLNTNKYDNAASAQQEKNVNTNGNVAATIREQRKGFLDSIEEGKK